MNELQKDGYDILCVIDDICKKHSIPYIMTYGTLLGAIRHEGFIPWDDDIDIAMTRSSYDKFKKVAATELKPPLVLQSMETEKYYHSLLPKVRDTSKPLTEYAHRYLDVSSGVWVDIFIFDKVPEDQDERNEFFAEMSKMYRKLHRNLLIFPKEYDGPIKAKVKRAVDLFNKAKYRLCKNRYVRLCQEIDEKCKTFEDTDSAVYADLCLYQSVEEMNRDILLEADFENIVFKKFESRSFPAPERYDEILRLLYGDYLTPPPEEKRKNIHYLLEGSENGFK